MSYRFSPRGLVALVLACGLAAAMVSPVFGDEGSPDQTPDDQTQQLPASTTSLDPCTLVTPAEASALAGTTYATGMEQTTDTGGRICVYGYQTLNVFMVLVAQSPDTATAQTGWDTEQARVQNLIQGNLPPGANVTLNASTDAGLDGYDRSATASASGVIGPRTLNVSGIYLLKGPTFVSYSDLLLDSAAPTTDALATQAQTVLGRLP